MKTTQPPLLVIVTGLPCTGKTALSRRLAGAIPLPLIAKDDLKENHGKASPVNSLLPKRTRMTKL